MLATHWGRLSVLVAATVFAAAACSTGEDAADAGADTVTRSAGGDVVSSPSPAIVMGFLTTVNRGEVEAGELARDKATNARVREYATMMFADHARALRDAATVMDSAAFATPVGQPAVDAQVLHEQAMNTLRTTSKGVAFDSTYMAMMVTGHQDVLARLEGMKGAGASDPAHIQLQNSIEMVRTHLERAQEIQQSLQGSR
jgi:putative membrane protein